MNYAPAVFGVKIIRHAGPEDFPRTKPATHETGIPFFQRQILTSFLLRGRGFAHDIIPHQDAGRFEHVIGPRTRCAGTGFEGGGGFAEGRDRPVATTDIVRIQPGPPQLRFRWIISAAAGIRACAIFGGKKGDPVFQRRRPVVAQRLPVARRVKMNRIGDVR